MTRALLLLLALTFACDDKERDNPPGPEADTDTDTDSDVETDCEEGDRVAREITSAEGDMGTVIQGNNDFAWQLYQALATEEGNLFIAPMSVSAPLAMTLAGAGGTTADEKRSVLQVGVEDAVYHQNYGALLQDLGGPDKCRAYELAIANKLWGQVGETWGQEFLAYNADDYGAPLEELDYAADPGGAQQTINDWVAEQTYQTITELLPDGSITEDTLMVLSNAIYLMAPWASPFDPDHTQEEEFELANGSTRTVNMMSQSEEAFGYLYEEDFALLQLPYEDDEFSMLVLLPHQADGLPVLEAALDAASLDNWVEQLEMRQVVVELPSFVLSWEGELSLTLADLGMPSAFEGKLADFSPMAPELDGNIWIDKVYHDTYVMVFEDGTVASGATAVVMKTDSGSSPAHFRADHPFLFVLRDDLTGSVMFIGRLADPG